LDSKGIERLKAIKANKRKEQEMADMKRLGLKYDCTKCTLGITESCINPLPDGCGYFFNSITDEQGFYYKKNKQRVLPFR